MQSVSRSRRPHNKPLLSRMPKTFAMPGDPAGTKTYYQVFTGPTTPFADRQVELAGHGRPRRDLTSRRC